MGKKIAYPVYIELRADNSCNIAVPAFAFASDFSNPDGGLAGAIELSQAIIDKLAKSWQEEERDLPDAEPGDYKKSRKQVMTYVLADTGESNDRSLAALEERDRAQMLAALDGGENMFEFFRNQKVMTVTLTQKKFVNKVKALAEAYPDEVRIDYENEDGSVCAKMPVKYLKLTRPVRTPLTEEQRAAAKERLAKFRAAAKENIESPTESEDDDLETDSEEEDIEEVLEELED